MKKKSLIQLASKHDCTACAACVSVCPKRCISMHEDKEGFLQPRIDASVCIECHKCEKVCPILNQETIPSDFETQAYAVINKDDEVRAQSSSGGVFFPLAKWVIEQGGVVFGARWNDKWEVLHDYAEDLDGVKAFMRSKYVQSIVGDTLRQAKQFLDAGRWVLYSGTPCQLGGLRAYLGKEYERLIQVDLICHGVPSPGVWRSYLKEYFGKEKIVDINFRDKRDGWNSNECTIFIKTENKVVQSKLLENDFFRGFRKDIYLRNSCYQCNFRNYHRNSDLTIADFWGVDKKNPSMYDNKGTSIVFIHTAKADRCFKDLSSQLYFAQQNKEEAIEGNRGMDIENPKCFAFIRCFFYGFRIISFKCAISVVDKFNPILSRGIRYIKKKIKIIAT